MKDEKDKAALEKLLKLTKLIKDEKIKIAPKGPPKAGNKWRAQDPKFTPPPEKSADSVEAGGMKVDPARQEEYENWRKDKLEEQNYRREAAKRKSEASKAARKPPEPPSGA